jgi:hypothetical protein
MSTTEAPSPAVRGSGSNDQLGQASEALQPVAYLYHDAATAEIADPLTHSTILVMRRHRLPSYRNETPLITLAQAAALVAAERERCAKLCDPTNADRPDDWTECAKERAECAARIRGA